MSVAGFSNYPAHPADFSKLPQLDRRTNDIVLGYLHAAEKQFFALQNCSYYNIKDIASIVLNFIWHWFMFNYGSFQWKITNHNHQITSFIKSFKNGQKYESQVFVIGRLNWKIEAYPNGYHKDSAGSFKLYVKLRDFPEQWSNVIVCRTTECIESHSKVTNICTYRKEESYGWTTGCLTLEEIKKNKYKSLTFVITIRILQINEKKNKDERLISQKPPVFYQFKLENYQKKIAIQWKISGTLMKKMKTANVGKKFESEIYDDFWCIQCCPNGRNAKSQGEVRIYLQLCSLPKGLGSICIQYTISCSQIGIEDKGNKLLSYMGTWVKTESKSVTFNQFKSLKVKQITISLTIQILNEYDLNGKDVSITETASAWQRYALQQKEKDLKQIKDHEMRRDMQHIKQTLGKHEKTLDLLQNSAAHSREKVDKLYVEIEEEKLVDPSNKKSETINCFDAQNIYKRLDSMQQRLDSMKIKMAPMHQTQRYKYNAFESEENKVSNESDKKTAEKNTFVSPKQQHVKTWLNEIGLGQYFNCFVENGFEELESVKCITMETLSRKEMKEIKLGHKFKIAKNVEKLNMKLIS